MANITPEISAPSVSEFEPQLWLGDCRERMAEIPDGSIHLVITDPPYFLDGLDNDWRKGTERGQPGNAIGGLPVGMKFDRAQGKQLQAFIYETAETMLPKVKPGSFAVVFSQPRLAHRMAVGLEDAGWDIRDLWAWRFVRKAQAKGFSLHHFIDKQDGWSEQEREALHDELADHKTAQLRPQFEVMLLAQRPLDGTHLEVWREHQVGLADWSVSLDGGAPSTLMWCEKENREPWNEHLTIKPQRLLRFLIQLLSQEGQTVLDPFLGSGSTCLAARATRRHSIGIEINSVYHGLAHKRLAASEQLSLAQ